MKSDSSPEFATIPHSSPMLGEEEVDQAASVIRSAQIAQGARVEQFEREFCRKFGYGDAAATSSGTAALHLVLSAMNIGPGDEVILPSFVCSALLHAINYVGATPVFAEINPDTCNIDPGDVKNRITPHTKAVIVPHLFGLAAEMNEFLRLDIPVIEDCAQAIGTTCQGKYTGTFGHASIFSFYATKVMTTGEGGMVASPSREIIDRIKDLREYDKKEEFRTRYNYKMTDLQAAIGIVQLNKLDAFIERRRNLAGIYFQGLKPIPIRLPPRNPEHIYYRYVIDLKLDSKPWIRRLESRGVECSLPIHFPLHLHCGTEPLTKTEKAWKQMLSLPIYPALSDESAALVIQNLRSISQEISK